MPVHHAWAGPILAVAVDGDFTRGELERVVTRALDARPDARRTGILLDLTGTATLAGKPDAELRATAAFFGAQGDRVGRIALLMAGDLVDEMMRMGTAFIAQDGVHAAPFRDRGDAEEWVRTRDPD